VYETHLHQNLFFYTETFRTIILYLGYQKSFDLLDSIIILNISKLYQVQETRFVNLGINLNDIWQIAAGRSSSVYMNSLCEDFKEKIEYVDPFTNDKEFYESLQSLVEIFCEYEIEYSKIDVSQNWLKALKEIITN